ncbi:MAG: 2-oxoglutarate ferredoxin oxidoreductase subunit alpha, partial [Gammaproteobacteria bacterium]
MPAGEYRGITGAEALSLGLVAAGELADRPLLFCSYPITPASPLLHRLARLGDLGVGTFQAEDEIAAICAAIGASYGGAIGVTSSSGPGIALKTEAMGLAVNAELPLVIVNSQRGGPSTGLPTKTEQSDLYQAVYGRNADTPIPVIAARSAGDCFYTAIEAVRIALRHMTPVILLSDGYLSNAAEPWLIPDMKDIEPIASNAAPIPDDSRDTQGMAFERNPETQGRPWITPGMPELMHRLGGIEKDIDTGHISYEPENHQRMTDMRAAKVESVANFIPPQEIELGAEEGELLIIGWGSTYGPIFQAVQEILRSHRDVSYTHLRYIQPLPGNLGELAGRFKQVLVPEMNMGQLSSLLRDKLGINPTPFCKVTGLPFLISELTERIHSMLPAVVKAVNEPVAKGKAS